MQNAKLKIQSANSGLARSLAIGLVAALLAAVLAKGTVWAANTMSGSTDVTQTITADSFTLTVPTSTTMSSVTVSTAVQTTTGTVTDIHVDDARGDYPALGWNLTVASSNFSHTSNTSIPDIDVTNLTVTPQNLRNDTGSSLTGVSLGSSHNFTGTTDQATVATAVSGAGNGSYYMDLGLSLNIPANQYAGSYEATLTFTAI
jgi:hypothetical protein